MEEKKEKTESNTKDKKIRFCLKCRKEFMSQYIGNRICNHCNDDNRKQHIMIITVLTE